MLGGVHKLRRQKGRMDYSSKDDFYEGPFSKIRSRQKFVGFFHLCLLQLISNSIFNHHLKDLQRFLSCNAGIF